MKRELEINGKKIIVTLNEETLDIEATITFEEENKNGREQEIESN